MPTATSTAVTRVSAADLNTAFGLQLREARRASGLSQEGLALSAGLDRTYISLLERGLRTPTLDVLFRLCQALGQQPEAFIVRIRERLAS